jgi:hypothetical protein
VSTRKPLALGLLALVVGSAGLTGCKSVSEKYIALEVWKYEKCFGHLPPGFVPPGAAVAAPAAPAMPVCGGGGGVPCQNAGCGQGGETVMGGVATAGGNCDGCQGGVVDGGIPAGGIPMGHPAAPSLPAGPGGSPGPSVPMATPASLSRNRPVVISDEVVLP